MTRHSNRIELLQGTLDLLVLRILLFGPFHGHAISKQIQSASQDVLKVETGWKQGWIASEWQLSDKGKRAKYYRLTRTGRKQLLSERDRWEQLALAMARVLGLGQAPL